MMRLTVMTAIIITFGLVFQFLYDAINSVNPAPTVTTNPQFQFLYDAINRTRK